MKLLLQGAINDSVFTSQPTVEGSAPNAVFTSGSAANKFNVRLKKAPLTSFGLLRLVGAAFPLTIATVGAFDGEGEGDGELDAGAVVLGNYTGSSIVES